MCSSDLEAPQGWRTRVGLVTREVIAPRVATDAHEREEKQARFDKLYSKFLGFSDDIDNLSANILLAQSEQNPERQLLMIDEGLKILTGIALKFDEIQSEWIEASDIAVLLPQYQSQMDSWTLSLEQHQAFVESLQRELSELRLDRKSVV